MAGLNDDAQWIVLMGFIVSIAIFFLALIVAESALVGKTTSESVLDFPKLDIQDLRSELMTLRWDRFGTYQDDIRLISLERKNAVISFSSLNDPIDRYNQLFIHYNNGVTAYNEIYQEYY
jgi:Fe2+ transport system protein B